MTLEEILDVAADHGMAMVAQRLDPAIGDNVNAYKYWAYLTRHQEVARINDVSLASAQCPTLDAARRQLSELVYRSGLLEE